MLFHRLTLLGALATLAVAAGKRPKQIPKAIGTKTSPPVAVPEAAALYGEGCPCYQQAEVDAFLAFAAKAEYCSANDYGYTGSGGSYGYGYDENYVSLDVSAYGYGSGGLSISRSINIQKYNDADGSCAMYTTYSDNSTSPVNISGWVDTSVNSYAYMYGEAVSDEISACLVFMDALKASLPTAGCAFSVYPCEYPCVNGNCGVDKCECYDGWTGDSCEDCDEDACVNGVCGEYGCMCNPGFDQYSYPPCSSCIIGFTGANCDVCDADLCVNGECGESGCVCKPGFDPSSSPPCANCIYGLSGDNCDVCDADLCINGVCDGTGACVCKPGFDQYSYPPCSYCEYGWTGDNCDECDETACTNGECTDTGCVCNGKWTGQYCDTCILGWASVDGDCTVCDAGWAGDNCDTCDPEVCVEGNICSSCMNGACSSTGCACEDGWFGTECSSAYAAGCPCFDDDDVAAFLLFAEATKKIEGYCEYYSDGKSTSAVAYPNSGSTYLSMGLSGDLCSSFRVDNAYVAVDATEAAACKSLLVGSGLAEKMKALDCSVTVP